ncbi:acyltransferase-like protein [Neofusicoccum parvum]|nr:acyltransferase-like protein [Neofusicoccum parvum]
MEKALLLPRSNNAPGPSRPPQSPTAWLNGIRGIASVIVALNHYLYGEFAAPWLGYGSSPDNRWLHQLPFIRLIWCGHAMPPVFFVISGYCACWSAIRLRDSHGLEKMVASLSASAFRRGLRLYLPVIFMSVLAQLVFFFGLYNWRWTEVSLQPWHRPGDHLKYLATYLLDITNPVYPTDNGGLNLQFWVIPVEYAGSLTCYVTVLALARTKPTTRPLILAALIASFLLRGNCHTYTFLSGVLIAELTLLLPHPPPLLPRLALLLGTYLLGLPNNYRRTPGYAWLAALEPRAWGAFAEHNWRAVAAALTVAAGALDRAGPLQRLGRARLPQRLGSTSFELYLCHMLLIRMWRNPLVDAVMAGFEVADARGFWVAYLVSGAVMATLVMWCAEGLGRVNEGLQGWARRVEGWAMRGG